MPRSASFQRIIVIVTRQIGDVLLTTPLIHAARQRWPDAVIDVLGFAGTLGMLRGNPDIGELIEVPPRASWRQSWPLIRRLWRRYDFALIAQYTDRAHLYGWVAARVRSGQVPAERSQSWWKRMLLRHAETVVGKGYTHVVLDKLRLMAPWVDGTPAPVVQAPPAAALPAEIAAQLKPRYVVMQVPSLVRYKQWPVLHYAQVVTALAQRGHQVVLTGGPSERDKLLVGEVIAATANAPVVNAAGQLDFNQMSALLHKAAVYVGPDTSITHLAAACGVPVVAMFGPIDPQMWGPWPAHWPARQPYEVHAERQQRGNVILLQGPQACVPCNGAGCDKHNDSRSECLETMAPKRVLDEVLALLDAQALSS